MPTFGGRVSPGERLRRLSPHECKAWVCSHHEGRLGYQSGRGHRSVGGFLRCRRRSDLGSGA
jgi:hypothetical protein